MPQNLFVYGSLRSGFRNPVYEYVTRFFVCRGDAVVKGKFYDKGPHPVAVASGENHFIEGELYSMISDDEFSWVFEQLDDYEGINTEPGEEPMYKREKVAVFQNGNTEEAWIYWYNGSVNGFAEISTGDVMKYMHQKNQP